MAYHDAVRVGRPVLDRFLRFVAIGAVLVPLNLGLTASLHELARLPEEAAFGISLVVLFLLGFAANRHLVFAASAGRVDRQLGLYLAASVAFRGLQFASFLAVHTWLGTPYLVAIVGVLGFWLVVKFVVFRRVVFAVPGAHTHASFPPS